MFHQLIGTWDPTISVQLPTISRPLAGWSDLQLSDREPRSVLSPSSNGWTRCHRSKYAIVGAFTYGCAYRCRCDCIVDTQHAFNVPTSTSTVWQVADLIQKTLLRKWNELVFCVLSFSCLGLHTSFYVYNAIPTTITVQQRLAFFHLYVKQPASDTAVPKQEQKSHVWQSFSTVNIVPKSWAGCVEDFIHRTKQICCHCQPCWCRHKSKFSKADRWEATNQRTWMACAVWLVPASTSQIMFG